MTVVDAMLVVFQAALGYGLAPKGWDETGGLASYVHSISLVLLSVLLLLSAVEIIGLGMEWYQPKHVVQLGVIIALLYLEIVQCWVDQICTWGGLVIFLLVPYRVNSIGWYASILSDIRENPSKYRRFARQLIDHPLTHVSIVALVVADFCLLGIELLVAEDYIGESQEDTKLAMRSLSRIRLTIYITFAVEIVLEVFVKGAEYFTMIENVVDALVVYACLVMELSLPRDGNDSRFVQFLMAIRFWRVFRIVYGVQQVMHEVDETGETELVAQTVGAVQDKLHGVNDTVSRVTSGVSDMIVDGVSEVTGVHELSEEELVEMRVEFRTLCYIVFGLIVGGATSAFFVLYLTGKYYRIAE